VAVLQLLSAHSLCFLRGDYLLPLPKRWRGRKNQQHIHTDSKALTDLLTNREELGVNVVTWAAVLTTVQGPEEDWEGKQQSCLDFGLQESKILLI